MSQVGLDTHSCLPPQLEEKKKKERKRMSTYSLTIKCGNRRKQFHLILQERLGSERQRREREGGESGERRGETGGHTLSLALMTFGKQRAPSALEET